MDLIVVEAVLELFAEQAGGRVHPIQSGYRPNHRFDSKSYYVGQVEFADDAWHYAGETNLVTIRFMPSPGLAERLVEGHTWDITEGSHVVGRAQLRRVRA